MLGPLEVGDNLTVEDDSVVFRVVVGDNVTVGEDVVIQGPAGATEDPNELTLAIPDRAVIPDDTRSSPTRRASRRRSPRRLRRCRRPAA